jgi:hypothetical protein
MWLKRLGSKSVNKDPELTAIPQTEAAAPANAFVISSLGLLGLGLGGGEFGFGLEPEIDQEEED